MNTFEKERVMETVVELGLLAALVAFFCTNRMLIQTLFVAFLEDINP
jgi:hypothetical protein